MPSTRGSQQNQDGRPLAVWRRLFCDVQTCISSSPCYLMFIRLPPAGNPRQQEIVLPVSLPPHPKAFPGCDEDSLKEVKDVFSPVVFEVAYSLGEHVIESNGSEQLPALTPILRWKKGGKIAQRNQTVFERNCLSDDCAADLRLRGQLLLSGRPPLMIINEQKRQENGMLTVLLKFPGVVAYSQV
ncbi:ITA9 protein, partial [Polypterus senegalus]